MDNPWGELTLLESAPYRGSYARPSSPYAIGEGRFSVIESPHSNVIGSHLTENGNYNNIVGSHCKVTGRYNTVIGSNITLEGNYNYVIAHDMDLKGNGMHITYPILLQTGKKSLNRYFPNELTNIVMSFAWNLDKGK
jgi:hypothetical protein